MKQKQKELTWISKEKRPKLRRELFNRQDEVEAQRNSLIDKLESQLEQRVEEKMLFNVAWRLV